MLEHVHVKMWSGLIEQSMRISEYSRNGTAATSTPFCFQGLLRLWVWVQILSVAIFLHISGWFNLLRFISALLVHNWWMFSVVIAAYLFHCFSKPFAILFCQKPVRYYSVALVFPQPHQYFDCCHNITRYLKHSLQKITHKILLRILKNFFKDSQKIAKVKSSRLIPWSCNTAPFDCAKILASRSLLFFNNEA